MPTRLIHLDAPLVDSGTEPKIKFYMEVQGEMGCRNCYASAESAAMEKIEAVKKSLGI